MPVREPRRPRDDRHHLGRKPAEVLARLLVGDLVQLPELPDSREPRGFRLEVGRRVAGQRRRLVRLRVRHRRVEIVVDQEAPDLLVRHLADELLDVDAAIPERAAFAVGLGDLGLDRDDPLETGLELVHLPRIYRTGGSSRSPGPTYSPAGRMILLFACCSST